MRDSLTPFLRRKAADPSAPGRELTEPERRSLPGGFDAVAEALASGRSPAAACAVAGRALAWDGVSLGEALSGLRDTCAAVGGAAPDVAAMESLAVAWSVTGGRSRTGSASGSDPRQLTTDTDHT